MTLQSALHYRRLLRRQPQCSALARRLSSTVEEAIVKLRSHKDDKVFTATFKRGAKPSVVVLGGGWAGFQVARDLDKNKYDVTVVSDKNYMLFTPLLASTTVGTLEYRCIQEPIRTIPGVRYYQATSKRIDAEDKSVVCEEVFVKETFRLPYDFLVVAVGARTNTFNVPGVCPENHVYFLKSLSDARAIRSRIIECFERASYPNLTVAEQSRLLSFVVVGGGPTSVEFACELHDFLRDDVHAWYPDLEDLVTVTLVEASNHILGTFDQRLVQYTSKALQKKKVEVLTGTSVTKVEPNVAYLKDGQVLHFGLCVWSTGVKPVALIEEGLPSTIKKGRGNRVLVDDRLRVPGQEGLFALGDCAMSEHKPLPMLAQVAQQQAKYLARVFNDHYPQPATEDNVSAFVYKHLGSMAQLGMWRGIMDTGKVEGEGQKTQGPVVSGLLAFLIWRSAYWTKSVSLANKMLIPAFWLKSWLFGRDISRF